MYNLWQMKVRWLGLAGIELSLDYQTLLIDPCVTRFPFWRMWIGRVCTDRERIAEMIPRADFVLVTHAHWDHLMDVPEVVRNTDATGLGSPNVCQILAASGAEAEQAREIDVGERLTLGSFQVEVLPAKHRTVLGQPIFGGPLPSTLAIPLRARDYQMDRYFSFLICADGRGLLDWTSERSGPAVPADVLFVRAYQTPAYYEGLLRDVQPRIVMPIHWDALFDPLDEPVRPMIEPPRWAWPPLRRVDLARFKETIERIAPQTQVHIPERFRLYDFHQLIEATTE